MASAKRYVLNEQKLAEGKKLGPQPELIVKAMMDAQTPLTVKEIADFIKDRLVTRQEPERVVNFYMSTWKKTGLVEVAGETPVSNQNSNDKAPAGDVAGRPHVERPPYDYSVGTLKDAIRQSLKEHGSGTAMDIHHNLQVAGRSTQVKAVADAISKLVKSGEVSRDVDGKVSYPEAIHA